MWIYEPEAPLQITLHRMRQNDRCCRSRHAMQIHSKMRPHKKHPAQCSRKCMQRPRQRPSLPGGVLRRPSGQWNAGGGFSGRERCCRCPVRAVQCAAAGMAARLSSELACAFSASGTHAAAAIFTAEYITLLAAATCLFLLGFSAFGPVLIVLFMMLYGAGNGILTVQLFPGQALAEKLCSFCLPQFRHLRRRPACAFWARQLCVSAAASGHTLSGRCIPVRNARARQCYSASTC